MPANKSRLQYLYQRFIRDEASAEEIREFWERMDQADENDPIKDSVFSLYGETVPGEMEEKSWNGALERITGKPKGISRKLVRTGWAAASILLITGAFSYFFFSDSHSPNNSALSPLAFQMKKDVAAPGANRATITLADGQKIYLDSSNNGMLARQGNVELKKTGDGQITYDKKESAADGTLVYNTLTNPRGSRVITMKLSDGSQLWLNAGSSVRFPVAFREAERRISITGEAYFEIAPDPHKKFIVMAGGVTTEVLGTHFDVNAYGDQDAIKVTLLEGSVKVTGSEGSSAMIKPGGQAVETKTGILKTNVRVNVDEVIAWKNEMFSFNNTGIREIMNEVARWYDVEIAYQGDPGNIGFGGNMSRQKNVSELLKRLEATQAVKFEIEGKKITVMKAGF